MPPTVKVKTPDLLVKKQREEIAQRVLDQFDDSLPDCRLLCFFDDEDCQEFKVQLGDGSRAFHRVISDSTAFAGWPEYITDYIFVDDPSSFWRKRVFDQVVYLYGKTCANSVGMTMSFAHELQHVIQRVKTPELLAANGLFRHLPIPVVQNVGLQWSDIPTEREARAVAKKIAVTLHGREAVNEFLEQRASATDDPIELTDVHFIRELDTSTPYFLKDETLALFGRFKIYRAEFESLIERFKFDPDFEPVDLDSFLPTARVNDLETHAHGI
jgi:hypothetical protein